MRNEVTINKLLGHIVESVEGWKPESDTVILTLRGGYKLTMDHHQCCCESVSVDSINGDPDSLVGQKVVKVEESGEKPSFAIGNPDYSFTWTTYTINGVSICWLGESNGYYSEDVTLTMEG